ncbi:hypothetical protein LXT21_11300 [Myxococcus sp. K38C18041901]|uniref:DUF7151 family protein n=1 Tax=Myxococcus guangdongensis TaxID=2906760 RepID=UPI0020A745B0|nr:hypothetical protein [Myxococcus guangdongensis]MCP3059360.1 hypothetical protein [Myxococcus guangdongensis]
MMRRLGVTLLSLLLAGCDGIDLSQLTWRYPPVTRFDIEPPGSRCPFGGDRVLTGIDHNEDGLLTGNEVVSEHYNCAGAPLSWLTRARPAEPTDTCPLGGVSTRSGLDMNRNSELEDEEVTHERLDCAGEYPVNVRVRGIAQGHPTCVGEGTLVEAGPDLDGDGQLGPIERRTVAVHCGEPSTRILARLEPEPVGGRCAAGGHRVDSGTDGNADGILQDTEVTEHRRVCRGPPVLDGDFYPTTEADFALLKTLFRIEGSLILFRTPLEQLVLPRLAELSGGLTVRENATLTRLELDALRFVGDSVEISINLGLEVLRFGAATQPEPVWMERSLSVWNNPRLVSLDGLRSVRPREDLFLAYNDSVQSLVPWDLESLQGSLAVSSNQSLSRLPFQNLWLVGGSLGIQTNPALTTMSFPELLEVGQSIDISGNASLSRLTGLTTLRSVHDTFSVSNNDALHSVDPMLGLRKVGALMLMNNPRLEAADFSSLQSIGRQLVVSNNPKLARLGAFPHLESLVDLELTKNALLWDVSGLEHIRSLRSLEVRENPSLQTLAGLRRLLSVTDLDIQDNSRLLTLDLDGLMEVTTTLTIQGNPTLPSCLANQLADRAFLGEARTVQDNDEQTPCSSPLLPVGDSVAAHVAAAGEDAP